MLIYDARMFGFVTAATAVDVWAPLGVMGGLIIVMFGWLKHDIRDLGHQLEKLEDAHSETFGRVRNVEGMIAGGDARWRETE